MHCIHSFLTFPFTLQSLHHPLKQSRKQEQVSYVNLSFPGCFGEAGACTQVSIHASASLRTRLCTEVLKTFSRPLISSRELKEHLSRTLPASFLLFSSLSLTASLWQVKCQEPGRGGVWRRRDKRFSPSINLKTYSADNLNGTGISFSMVTRDGRRLEKERTDPGKSDVEEAGKVVNFATSLCCASCM